MLTCQASLIEGFCWLTVTWLVMTADAVNSQVSWLVLCSNISGKLFAAWIYKLTIYITGFIFKTVLSTPLRRLQQTSERSMGRGDRRIDGTVRRQKRLISPEGTWTSLNSVCLETLCMSTDLLNATSATSWMRMAAGPMLFVSSLGQEHPIMPHFNSLASSQDLLVRTRWRR